VNRLRGGENNAENTGEQRKGLETREENRVAEPVDFL